MLSLKEWRKAREVRKISLRVARRLDLFPTGPKPCVRAEIPETQRTPEEWAAFLITMGRVPEGFFEYEYGGELYKVKVTRVEK